MSIARRLRRRFPSWFPVVLSLSVGTGVVASAFQLIDRLLLRPLPGLQAEGLVRVFGGEQPGGGTDRVSYRLFERYRDGVASVADLAAYSDSLNVNLAVPGTRAERISAGVVSPGFFRVMGMTPALGRLIDPEDVERGRRVVVLGNGYWMRRFGRTGEILGRAIVVNGEPFEVVGVTPRFQGLTLGANPDVWLPVSSVGDVDPVLRTEFGHLSSAFFSLVGRLQAGRSIDSLNATLSVLGARYGAGREVTDPALAEAGTGWRAPWLHGVGAGDAFAPGARRLGSIAAAIALIVLVVGVGNAVGLLAVQQSERRHEKAIMLALGAPHRVLIGGMALEVLGYTVPAAGLGWVFGIAATGLGWLPVAAELPADGAGLKALVDGRILGAVTLVSIIGSAAAVFLPGIQALRFDALGALRVGGTVGARVPGLWLRRTVVVAQIAGGMVLLTLSATLARTVSKITAVELGFDPAGSISASIDLPRQGYSKDEVGQLLPALLEAVEAEPGVRRAAFATSPPPRTSGTGVTVDSEGGQLVGFGMVTAGYFEALGWPVVRGRGFRASDEGAKVALVNESFVRHYWPTRDPLGRQVDGVSPTKSSVEVVGVVRDTWPDGAFEAPKPALFVPLRSFYDAFPWQPATFLVVRGVAAARAVEAGVERVAPGTPVYDIAPIADRLFPAVASREDLGRALLILGSIAALLAIVGVNALLGRILAERTSEFGLRLALGSTRRGIVGLVLRNVALLLGVALVLGGLGAIAALGSIRHLLFGVDGLDLLSFSVAGAVLLVPIIGMALWSGLRATRVDLTSALRCE